MVQVWMAGVNGGAECLSDYGTLTEALSDVWEHWCEESGPQLFWAQDEEGRYLATLLRDASDPEVCHVTMASGHRSRVRCHYVLDAQGCYESTETTVLD